MASTQSKLLIGLALVSFSSIGLAFGPQWNAQNANFGPGYRMVQELNLSAEQQEQFSSILQTHREEGQAWRTEHYKELQNKLGAVLDEQQLEQFKALRQGTRGGKGMRNYRRGPYGPGMGRGMGYRPCQARPF